MNTQQPHTHFGDGRDWFFQRRFGLFIHWGLYAIPAWHEQIQWRKGVPRAQYQLLIQQFNPIRFNPDEWLDLAEEAGMSYLCFTTKHHDGFCLWNTAQTDYNVMHSPYGKDILGLLAEACHHRHIPLCLYYSVVDWHQPNYPNQDRSHELPGPEPGDAPDIEKYMRFLRAQARELCTQYGEIHGFWWDMNVTGLHDPSVNALIRELQPNAVINNRGFDDGDFGTPERDMDDSVDQVLAFDHPTEACQSVGVENWGYKTDEDYYTLTHLLRSIDKTQAKGGNYLLNVGPHADGTIPQQPARMLRDIGHWYQRVREAFDGTVPASHLTDNRDVLLTRRGNTIYVHLYKAPASTRVLLKPIDRSPRQATLLNNGEPVDASVDFLPSQFRDRKAYLRIRNLPANALDATVPIVKLDFDSLDV
ncbi:MAG: alpha-L-fucosidase [Chloroflexi bacterium]|nr:alpha-L-fucosidase [Chloroflexota bacterium]